ncbi:hypothetical protein SAMN04488505_108177 [Chitinophaga rupis]|uniref:Uncharacterized protein n=1 Tax=Chitinophaga rupis TaxID=573321 RepID=A0A1H8E340_9BACT|nr:hypothetical protein [Chitinophaga rupis]SEN14001.1 hypothetical protein SAMN04488505_108177 [Chitinophaga rupis]
MQQISFFKKLITCTLAGLVIGASTLRISFTFLRAWIPVRMMSIVPLLLLVAAIIYAVIWQLRKTNHPATLAFWQGLLRYGVAFDLATFGWEKLFHLQFVVSLSKLDLPYSSFSSQDLFWAFFSYSYPFGCIIAGCQLTGAMLLLFHRTRLAGVFILLPVLVNILLMDIFYKIGPTVVVHVSIMLSGTLYFLFIEFNRLKEFFFAAKDQLPALHFPQYLKMAVRLSIIYIPLLLIAMRGKPDHDPQLRGKYEVEQLKIDQQILSRTSCADSILTLVYFDSKNGCVFEYNSLQRRWYGVYKKENDHLEIKWRTPAGKPVFTAAMSPVNAAGNLILTGMMGNDPMTITLKKINN